MHRELPSIRSGLADLQEGRQVDLNARLPACFFDYIFSSQRICLLLLRRLERRSLPPFRSTLHCP